jgi:hypothetical protein
VITTSRPGEWALRPAVVYVVCPGCGGLRRQSLNPHGPRWVKRGGVYVQVDCSWRLLAAEKPGGASAPRPEAGP